MDVRDRIDPEVRRRLDQYVELVGEHGLAGIADVEERRRRQAELRRRHAAPTLATGVDVQDVRFGEEGLVRLYRPATASAPTPFVLHAHGGGLVSGSVAQDDGTASDLALATGAVVASVDYRLAPEHRYPAALDDCAAALDHLLAHHDGLGLDPDRFALHGPSAGGCLVAGLALLLRDRGGPAPALLVLVSPMLDDRASSPSMLTNTGFGAWSREATVQAWAAVLGVERTDPPPAYAAPGRAADLAGLPPTYVDVGDLDPFRDEAVDLARRLSRAGVPVELHVYPGGIHGGESLAPDAELSVRTRGYRRDALVRALKPVVGRAGR